MRRLFIFASSGLALATFSTAAHAGSFTSDGTFVFDPTAVATFDFEAPSTGGTGGMGQTGSASASASSGVGGGMQAPAEPALEGSHSLVVPPFAGVSFPVSLPFESRTYRVSAWIYGSETTGDFEVTYPGSASVDEFTTLYPTGRMTSDGWIEVANDHVRVEGARAPTVTVGFFSANGSRVDAVEVIPDGTIAPNETNAACSGVMDAGTCGPEQVCLYSVCRNVGGGVPPIPKDRDNVADYLASRANFLFGPDLEHTLDVPNARLALEQMRNASDKWTYWNGFMLAVRRLHDGHTTTSSLGDFVLKNKKPITACFIEGDGDLSDSIAPKDPTYLDVIVSHTGADHNLGLKAGDRLVSVDGQHPIAWARSLIEIHWGFEPTSNHRTFAELAETMRSLISRYAHEIVVIRCDPSSSTCAAPETISITDLPELMPNEMVQGVACDNRPLRHLATSPADHSVGDQVYSGILNDSNTTERIYGLEWESLYTTTGSDGVGAAINAAVAQWTADANGVLLDHRSGNGGTNLGYLPFWSFKVPFRAIDMYQDRQQAEEVQPTVADGLAIFNNALAYQGSHPGSQPMVEYGGSNSPSHIPVAILTTRDVSASDWLPFGMKGAPGVKIFAPFETNGGFSTRYAFGYWLGLNYVMAVGDTFDPEGHTLNGTGVTPDVVVLPKQSDLLVGKDTLYEAALAWIRSQ